MFGFVKLGKSRYGMMILAIVASLALSTLWLATSTAPAFAVVGGPVVISGDDADDFGHCSAPTACGSLYANLIDSIIQNSAASGGTADILAIGPSFQALTALNNWNNATPNGPYTIQNISGAAAIAAANFADFKMIYVPSDSNTPGGIAGSDLVALNARQADIQNYVNNLGGGVLALTEGFSGANAYGWLPIPLTFNFNFHNSEPITPTAALTTSLSPGTTTGNLTHCCLHNVFTGPAGFSGMDVLAFHDHNGNGVYDGVGSSDEVVLLGGINVVLTGQISLDPLEAFNEIGATHTVTATVVDDDGNPLSGETVDFVVTSGPNSGETGTDTTDANGHASFTYTDSGGVGTDTIEASFTDATGVIRTVTAQKTWGIATCDDLLISRYDPIANGVELVNVGDGPISIDGCSFVTYNAFTELSIGAATTALSGILDVGETLGLVFPPSSMPDGPGGIAVLDAPPPPDGTPVGAVLADDITGMVYLSSTTVFGVAHLRVPAHNAIYDCIYGGSGAGPFAGPFTPVSACLGGP